MYLTEQQLDKLGLGSCGDNVLISDKASLYNTGNIHLGDNIRIDDFAVLSAGDGGIYLHGHNHVSTHAALLGNGMIEIGRFSNVSIRATILTSTNDFSGEYPSGIFLSKDIQNINDRPVTIGEHCIIGTHSVVLPGTMIYHNTVVGANSVAKGMLHGNHIYAGCPAEMVKSRSDKGYEIAMSYDV